MTFMRSFFPLNEYNGENERLQKEKKNPRSEVETAGQVRGCVNSQHTQGNMFSCDILIIQAVLKATQRVCVLDSSKARIRCLHNHQLLRHQSFQNSP